jgi:tetratricopeptide (TPR) repeat protein
MVEAASFNNKYWCALLTLMVLRRSSRALQKALNQEFKSRYSVSVDRIAESLKWDSAKVIENFSDVEFGVLSSDSSFIYAKKSIPIVIKDNLTNAGLANIQDLTQKLYLTENNIREAVDADPNLIISSTGVVIQKSRMIVDLTKRLNNGEVIDIVHFADSSNLDKSIVKSLISELSMLLVTHGNCVRSLGYFVKLLINDVIEQRFASLDSLAESYQMPSETLDNTIKHSVGRRVSMIRDPPTIISPKWVHEIEKSAGEEGDISTLAKVHDIDDRLMEQILHELVRAEVANGKYRCKTKTLQEETTVQRHPTSHKLEILQLWSSMQFLTVMSDPGFMMFTSKEIDKLFQEVSRESDLSDIIKVHLLLRKAELYKKMGQSLGALKIYAYIINSVEIPSILAEFYHTMYEFHLARGTQDRVTHALEKDLETSPSGELLCLKAKILCYHNKYQEALDVLTQAQQMNPVYYDTTKYLVRVHHALSHYDDALSAVDTFISLKPDHEDALLLKSQLLKTMHRFDEALECYRRVLKNNDKEIKYHLLIAAVLDVKGDVDKAIRTLEKSLKNTKPDGKDWREVGVFLSNEGAMNLAEFALKKAIKMSPNEPEYIRDLALVYRRAGDLDKAIAFVESHLSRFEQSDRVLRIYADFQLTNKNYKVAEEYARRALASKPKDPTLHVMLGDILLRMGKKEGVGWIQKAIEMNPNNLEIYIRAGLVYTINFQLEQAKSAYSAALNISPNYKPALIGLERVEALGSKKISVQKLYEQVSEQMKILASDDYEPSPDGASIRLNIKDALVDDSE